MNSSSCVTAFATAMAVAVPCWALSTKAAEVVFPKHLAFNGGLASADAMDKAKAAAIADVERHGSSQLARHIRIEVHEGSASATRDQVVFFGFCQSTFVDVLSGGSELSRVEAEFLILDAFGKPIGDAAWRITIKKSGGKKWNEETTNGKPIKGYYADLPPWARQKLQILSGFLHDNPGEPPVPWEKAKDEKAAAFLGNLLGIPPSTAKQVLLVVAENLVKKASVEALKEAFKNRELRCGLGPDLRNDKIKQFGDDYQKKGAIMWLEFAR